MKKALSVLLCLCLVLSVFTALPFAASAAEVTEESVGAKSGTTGSCRWTLDNGALTISGNGAMGDYSSDSSLPWGTKIKTVIIEGGVTSIGEYAFFCCENLTSVTIPDSVTSIGDDAFSGCTGLTSVAIGNSVTSIGSWAFYNCTGLTSVTIPDSVTSIGSSAFRGCTGLTNVTIPDSVTSIGSSAFDDTAWYNNQPDGLIYAGKVVYRYKGTMPNNTSIILQDGTKGIANSAFYGCKTLTSVTIPDSVTSIGGSAFSNTGWYNNQPDGLVYAGKVAYKYKGTMPANTSITLQDGTKGIANSAFVYCASMTSVTIPDSVTSIGDKAFYKCTGLTSVHITDIGAWCNIAFSDYAYNPLSYAHNLYLNGVPVTNLVIPDSVTSIGGYAFYECTGLTSVTIPDSVTSIGSFAFEYCTGLTSVTIPNSVTSIGSYAFFGCTGLTSVTIGNSVTSIGGAAFYRCTGLTSVAIGNSVTSIGSSAFFGCTGLTSVTIPDSVTSIGYGAFYHTAWYNNQPDGLIYAGKVAYNYKGTMPYNTSITIKDGTKEIAASAFYDCTGLTSVTIPDSVTSIGDWAFENCTGLTSVTIPDSVTSIGDRALGYYDNHGYNFTILGVKGSKAEQYAKNNGFKFIAGEKICPHCYSLLSSEQVITFAATCTEDGERYWQCDQCGELGEDVLPNLGHNYKTVITQPTCTKGGYTTHTCSHCKDAYVTDEVAALGHDYHRADVVLPTCTEQGYTPYTCSRCSEIKKEDIVDALGHDWNITVMRQPTETQQGVMSTECKRCSLKKMVTLPVLSDQDYTLTTSAKPGKVTYTLKDKTYGVFETVADAPEGWFADGTTGDCTWEKKGDQLIISGNGKMDNYTDSNPAPWKGLGITKVIIDKGVTSIGDYAFLYCNSSNVTIPDSVTSIGVKALGYYYNYGYKKVSGFTIYGSPGSEAERYANDNGFTFIEYVDAAIGDMTGDGKINVRDVTAMQRHLAGLEELTDDRLALADTNGDGKVDINDATHLQRYLAEFDVVLGKQN